MDVAERCPSWSKEHDWKSCVVKSHREFESPPLRQIFIHLGSVQSKKSFLARD